MLVPLKRSQRPNEAGTEERMFPPGALTSGFICSETGVGPLEEKFSIVRVFEAAPTVIDCAAEPGEPTDPKPKSSNSFPAATTGTTPAAAAPLSAATTRSRDGSRSEEHTSELQSPVHLV